MGGWELGWELGQRRLCHRSQSLYVCMTRRMQLEAGALQGAWGSLSCMPVVHCPRPRWPTQVPMAGKTYLNAPSSPFVVHGPPEGTLRLHQLDVRLKGAQMLAIF